MNLMLDRLVLKALEESKNTTLWNQTCLLLHDLSLESKQPVVSGEQGPPSLTPGPSMKSSRGKVPSSSSEKEKTNNEEPHSTVGTCPGGFLRPPSWPWALFLQSFLSFLLT